MPTFEIGETVYTARLGWIRIADVSGTGEGAEYFAWNNAEKAVFFSADEILDVL